VESESEGNAPPLALENYCGHYTNGVYGSLDIRQDGGRLTVKFNSHDDLTAKMDYMDNGEWLLQYDNIEYGVFQTKFEVKGKRWLVWRRSRVILWNMMGIGLLKG